MIRRGTIAAAVFVAVSLSGHGAARADLAREMDRMLDGMTNVTPPGVWETQRRGVLSGGSLSQRHRIMNQPLVSFVPPSFNAGCGGVDLFGGSFSFINADQFVQLMRGVAQNAKGLAFQMAIQTISPELGQTIEMLQKKVQELNQFFGNSCQMAKGVLNDTKAAITGKQNNDASLIRQVSGLGDTFESFSNVLNRSPVQDAQQGAPQQVDDTIKGNVVWRALQKSRAMSWAVSGDIDLLQAVMTLTGTVIVDDLKPSADGGQHFETKPIEPGGLKVVDLINGGQLTLTVCADGTGENQCRKVSSATRQMDGLQKRVTELLIGKNGNPGIIQKLRLDAELLSPQEKGLLAAIDLTEVGPLIVSLSRESEGAANAFARSVARHIATDMASAAVRDLLRMARTALTVEDSAYAKEAGERIASAARNIEGELAEIRASNGSDKDLVVYYKSLNETRSLLSKSK